jgi:hypothetical protein
LESVWAVVVVVAEGELGQFMQAIELRGYDVVRPNIGRLLA